MDDSKLTILLNEIIEEISNMSYDEFNAELEKHDNSDITNIIYSIRLYSTE